MFKGKILDCEFIFLILKNFSNLEIFYKCIWNNVNVKIILIYQLLQIPNMYLKVNFKYVILNSQIL